MRRALLLVIVLAAPPLLARAQSQPLGSVTFQNGRTFPMYINATECAGGTVTAAWNAAPSGSYTAPPTTGYYVVYGSNQQPRNVNGVVTCWTPNDVTAQNPGLAAGQVLTTQNSGAPLATSATIGTQTFIAAAGKSCSDNGVLIYICVQGFDSTNGAIFGYASAGVTIDTNIPPPPTITGITPGNEALNVSWDAGAVTSTYPGDSYSYQLTAEMVGTTTAATDPNTHVSSMFTATSARFGGLVNTVTYAVTAKTYSKAGNPSIASDPMNGTPQFVNDFWDTYKNDFGGRDSGGCAGGAAGPLALAVLAGALALSRRAR